MNRDRYLERLERQRADRAEGRELAAREAMHLTYRGRVLCGDEQRSLLRISAAQIKQPLTRTRGQVNVYQRKLLDGHEVCPNCHKALHKLAEDMLQRVLAADVAVEVAL